jgi:hypothetical protein
MTVIILLFALLLEGIEKPKKFTVVDKKKPVTGNLKEEFRIHR